VTSRRVPLPLAGVWDKVSFWHSLAAALGVLALALLVAALVARAPPDFSALAVIAVVRDGGQHPIWAVRLARGAHQIAIDSLRPQPMPAGRAYQLWLETPSDAAPRPLGVLPQSGRKIIAETPANARLLTGRGELRVTLEAGGGSLAAAPSGPGLFRARLDGPAEPAHVRGR
jgi:anti-sigma-K factor RskA